MAEQISSKKWVDYSDEDSDEEEQHPQPQPPPQTPPPNISEPAQNHKYKPVRPSREQINAELDKLDELEDLRVDEVWLLMTSSNQAYLQEEAKYLKGKAKKGGNIVSVLPSRTPNAYDVKVYINIAYDYIEKGYDSTDEMSLTVADRNFERQNHPRESRRGRPAELKQKNSQNEKKRYVDKETGLEPEPKNKKEEESSQNDRKYSKQEAERKGELLANFRAKSKKEEEPTKAETKEEEEKQEVQPEAKQQGRAEKVQVKEKKEKKEKKVKGGGSKFASKNRFEGIQDLS